MEHHPIVIIGAGVAGCAAALESQRLGKRPMLLDRAGRAGGLIINARRVEGQLGLEASLDGPAYVGRLSAQLSSAGLVVQHAFANDLRHGERGFVLQLNGEDVAADAVVVANGTEPETMGFAGEESLSGRRLFCEVRPLLAANPKPREIALIGSGEMACDYALTLADLGATVHLLSADGTLEARGRLADEVQQHPGIVRAFNTRCESVREVDDSVELRLVRGGQHDTLAADAVLIASGRESRAPQLLDRLRAVVRPDTTTSIPGLFVAGDARSGFVGHASTAMADGVQAARLAVAHAARRSQALD